MNSKAKVESEILTKGNDIKAGEKESELNNAIIAYHDMHKPRSASPIKRDFSVTQILKYTFMLFQSCIRDCHA